MVSILLERSTPRSAPLLAFLSLSRSTPHSHPLSLLAALSHLFYHSSSLGATHSRPLSLLLLSVTPCHASTPRVQFLKEPARARNGMPARPVVGTAVSIPLDLNQEQIEEWFGSGYL